MAVQFQTRTYTIKRSNGNYEFNIKVSMVLTVSVRGSAQERTAVSSSNSINHLPYYTTR